MSTPVSQRIGIWIITVILIIGTMGSLVAMALSVNNQQTAYDKMQVAMAKYQEAVNDQKKALHDRYYEDLANYAKTIPSEFDASSVTELSIRDLKVGDGEEITPSSIYNAYYVGWNPKGKIFDQSISDDELKDPISGGNLIEGWNEGVVGMKIGGVRELTIPSEKAYKEAGSGEDIPPNTPLKFIVMVIPQVEQIPMPPEILEYYSTQMSQ